MNVNRCFIPECYIDTCLIEVLLNDDKNYVNHQKGNGTVAREMKDGFSSEFCVGIIDEDRKALDYLGYFDVLVETEHLRLWKHREKPQYFIQLRPVIEKWIMAACNELGISLKDFGLPDELKEFKRISKSVTSKRDQRFIGLFKEMRKKGFKALLMLQDWLVYLKENKYKADINQLKNG